MEGRGKSRRRSPYRVWKRRGSALLAVLLTLSLMLGDISGLSRVVMAGQGTVREEFQIHREDILKAAEEAIENGEPLSEPLAITSEEEKTEEKYQEILPADGSVYEIFPDIEQVKEVDSLELRIFIRLAEGADPASYTLTGDETLVFLYVNGGDVTAEGRVNIDGYVSEFTKVAAFESEEEPMQPGGDTGAVPGNGAAGSGNGSGNGAAGGSGTAGSEAVGSSDAENDTAAAESESNGSDSMDPEDSAADLDGETEAESEEVGNGTSEDGMSPEETLPTETQEPESSAAEETEAAEQPSGQTPDDATSGDQPDGSGADGTASDDNTAEAGTGSADEDKETATNTENGNAADDALAGNAGGAEDNSQADQETAENEKAEADNAGAADQEKTDAAENAGGDAAGDHNADGNAADSQNNEKEAADGDNGSGSIVTMSLRNIQKVAASLASPSEAETPAADESSESQEGKKETAADKEDSYDKDSGAPVDEEDAAEAEDEEDTFKKTHDLKGRKLDEAVLDETVTVRAFSAGMEDAGFNREDLLEGAHQLTYTVAEGEARLVYTPEYVRDEAVVTFGVIPAEGMEVYQVTANGEALAETEASAAIASASEAKRAKASSSDADYDEERTVYYQIPQVLEDQTVEIQVVEEGYNDHPAFLQSRTVNGVTVTVSAEEGILPAGTELSVEEVTEQVADAVAEKVEAEAPEEEPVSVTSVLAYDINLMLDGKKLANSYWEGNSVSVRFSGERVVEVAKEADKIEIAALETPTEKVEAAFGETEEAPVIENINAQDIEIQSEGRLPVDADSVSDTNGVETNAEHFTIYVVIGENQVAQWNGSANVYTEGSGQGNITIGGVSYVRDGTKNITFKSQSGGGTAEVTIGDGGQNYKAYYRYRRNNQYRYYEVTSFNITKSGYFIPSYQVYAEFSDLDDVNYRDNYSNFVWIPEGDTTWTITFDPNGGEGEAFSIEAEQNTVNGQRVYSFTTPYAEEHGFVRDGYIFVGWSITPSGNGDATSAEVDNPGTYIENVQVSTTQYHTYYAIWLPESGGDSITAYYYVRTDGNVPFEPSSYGKGDYFPALLPGDNYERYYNLKGTIKYAIAVNNNLVAVRANLGVIPSNEDIQEEAEYFGHTFDPDTQYVEWYVIKKQEDWHVDGVIRDKNKYKVTYYPNGGNENVPPQTEHAEGENVKVRFDRIPQRAGYNFLGWDQKKDAITPTYPYTVYQSGSEQLFTMPDCDVDLYAIWEPVRFTLQGYKVWNDNNNSGGYRPESVQLQLTKKVGNDSAQVVSAEPVWTKGTGNSWTWRYENLPEYENDTLIEYDVKEIKVDSNYEVSYSTDASGIPIITNSLKTGEFYIQKLFEGKTDPDSFMYGAVSFRLYYADQNWNKGDVALETVTVDENGIAQFSGLSAGKYWIAELETAPGYVICQDIKLEVIAESGTFIYKVNDQDINSSPDGKLVYQLTNYRGAELPETGGPGLIMMERFGWMLLLLALVGADVQLFSRKRRKHQ